MEKNQDGKGQLNYLDIILELKTKIDIQEKRINILESKLNELMLTNQSSQMDKKNHLGLTYLDYIPNEVIFMFFGHLTSLQRFALSRVCKIWDYLIRCFKTENIYTEYRNLDETPIIDIDKFISKKKPARGFIPYVMHVELYGINGFKYSIIKDYSSIDSEIKSIINSKLNSKIHTCIITYIPPYCLTKYNNQVHDPILRRMDHNEKWQYILDIMIERARIEYKKQKIIYRPI